MSTAPLFRAGQGRRRMLGLLAGMTLLALPIAPSHAEQESAEGELRLKAVFVYKFTGYVTWPDSAFATADEPLVIGVQGSPAMLRELVQLVEGRRVQDRPIVVRQVRPGESIDGLHVLFVARQEPRDIAPVQPLLTVTEAEGEMPRGSIINFRVIDRRVRFEIARGSADQAGLRLSSRLLSVALKVYPGEGT